MCFPRFFPRNSINKVIYRAFWNKENFYCAVTVFDKHLFAEVESQIDKPMIHLNDGIELYFDTKNEGSHKLDVNDYQFLISIKNENEVFKGDLREILADTFAVPKDYAQNILFTSAVKINGTLNDQIIDTSYTIEVEIPFAAIGIIPETNLKMHLDVGVNDIDYPLSETTFIEEASTSMWSFNWSGFSDFGYPVYWREANLAGGPGWAETISDKYKSKWFWIYLFTVIIAIAIVSFLIYRTYKLRRLPLASEITHDKLSINQNKEYVSHNSKILQQAAQYIMDNSSETIHSEELAGILGVSLRTLQRITNEELNMTPTNYINVVKLQLAAEYLKNHAGNIADAAYEFGFSEPSYFSKKFKKHFEVSPSEYVKKHTK